MYNSLIYFLFFYLSLFFSTTALGQDSSSSQAITNKIPQEETGLPLIDNLAETSIRERVLGTKYTEKFSLHNKLNYAIIGENDAKLQFSFKYRPVENFNLFMAYGNLILWDIYESSQPYKDINFNPEIFYRIPGWNQGLFSIDVGYWHNSNGKDQDDSRAWDRLYLRLNAFTSFKRVDFYWMTTIFESISTGSKNPDITKYLGFWETSLYATRLFGKNKESLDLEFVLQSGEDGRPFDRGSFLIGAKFSLGIEQMNPYFYLQYFNGYGESLLHYDKRSKEIRAGIAFFY